jgi:hypothetical protein
MLSWREKLPKILKKLSKPEGVIIHVKALMDYQGG